MDKGNKIETWDQLQIANSVHFLIHSYSNLVHCLFVIHMFQF